MQYNLPSFYQKYPIYNLAECNSKNEKDIEYLNMLYPDELNELNSIVHDECERVDYDGSMIYDEYPDKIMFSKFCSDICSIAKFNCKYGRKCNDYSKLHDIVTVLISNDIYKRRCRKRNYFSR